MTPLSTVRDVMDAFGGTPKVAKMLRVSYRAAHNWLANGSFPAHTYFILTDALAAKGLTASRDLWRMTKTREPRR